MTRLSLLQSFLLIGSFLSTSRVWGASVPCGGDSSGAPITDFEWQPRTPEQTLYAYVRCLNDSSASVNMKIRWVRWQPDASPESQCYVKCVSEELRLYDSKERRFHPERFVQQADMFYNADPAELEMLRTDAHPMLAGVLEDDSCEAVFNKYAHFYTTHTNTILRMFHGDYRDLGNTYQMLGTKVKQIGQTFIDYCEKRYGDSWSEDESCPSTPVLDCIFRGFRWITEEGYVNVNEIRRDYNTAGYSEETDFCDSVTPGARPLYQCLRDKGAEKLGKVIRERNVRTAFYFDITSQEEPWKSAVEFANNLV